jgi:EPS-associated MarR family transcriptional regulator
LAVASHSTDNDADLLKAMRLLSQQPQMSQRELSQALGLSLGKTNFLLRALLEKGHLKVRNFRRSDNKLAYAYLLTPNGIKEKLRLTRAFLARKEAEFDALQDTINRLRAEVEKAEPTSPRAL